MPIDDEKTTPDRCQLCEHGYEDHGDEDQCPGEYGGEPRARPTWTPPQGAGIPSPERFAIGVDLAGQSMSLNVTTYVARTDGGAWEQVPPATVRGNALSRYLNGPLTEEDFERERQELWRRVAGVAMGGIDTSVRLTDRSAPPPARSPLPSNRAITARPAQEVSAAPQPSAFATLGDAVELDREPRRPADPVDIHAERYRMIELD